MSKRRSSPSSGAPSSHAKPKPQPSPQPGTGGGGEDAIDLLVMKADEQAAALHADRVNTGHLMLAVLRASGSEAARLLEDSGVEYPLAATQVEKLVRMQEGGSPDDPVTGKAADTLQRAYALPATAGAPQRLLAAMLADNDCIGTRALEKVGIKLDQLRTRIDRLVQDAAVPATTGAKSAAPTPGAYLFTPAQYAAMAVDGDYQTAVQRKPFHLQVRNGDIHIYSGWRYQKKAYDGDGNSVFWEKERVIRECVEFVRRMGEVELGPCAENKVPGPDTFEAFLRQFSVTGNLASYLPSVLERLGAIRIEKRAKGVGWAVADGRVPVPGEADGEEGGES